MSQLISCARKLRATLLDTLYFFNVRTKCYVLAEYFVGNFSVILICPIAESFYNRVRLSCTSDVSVVSVTKRRQWKVAVWMPLFRGIIKRQVVVVEEYSTLNNIVKMRGVC